MKYGALRPVFLPLAICVLAATCVRAAAASPESLFHEGLETYRAGDYRLAAKLFESSVAHRPASGTLQNLGTAEWQRGRIGPAVLAWERALWIDPRNASARMDLRFARKVGQIEAPDLAWYEVVSTWLPSDWWAWLTAGSLWLAVGTSMLPGILRRRRTSWHQAVAALGLTVFLLSVPAQVGVGTRSRIGFVLQKDSPLRLTPTVEAQSITRLAGGEPVRWQRQRGNFLLVRASRAVGWVEREDVGLLCPLTSP